MTVLESSATAATSTTVVNGDWWLKNPLDATYDMIVVPAMETFDRKRKKEHSVYEPLSRADYVVVRGVIRTERFPMTLEFLTAADFNKFLALFNQNTTLLLQRGYTTEQWYGEIAGDYQVVEARYDPNYKLVSFEFVETAAP